MLNARALGSLQEFGRCVSELEHKARHTVGFEPVKALLMDWLQAIGYEAHLLDASESPRLAAQRWSNVLDFVDWIAKRCDGTLDDTGSVTAGAARVSLLDGDDQNVVTLSTLHAAKGLEWPHVVLAGVNEGLLPFRSEDDDMTAQRLEEERRLMYVGITRARVSLGVSVLQRRKRARQTVVGVPSRFVAEMQLARDEPVQNPRDKLKALRAAAAARAQQAGAATPE